MANWWEIGDWSEWDSLGEGEGQQYGLKNLDRLRQGFQFIYQQNTPQASELVGPLYKESSLMNEEDLIRQSFDQQFDNFLNNREKSSLALILNQETGQRAVGQSGFAGGGTARANLEDLTEDFAMMSDLEHQAMQANQLSATEAIYNVRKSYVDHLWRHYTDWQVGADPFFEPDWEQWEDVYVESESGAYNP